MLKIFFILMKNAPKAYGFSGHYFRLGVCTYFKATSEGFGFTVPLIESTTTGSEALDVTVTCLLIGPGR